MLEIDLELVAFDRGDGAVAEFAVEDALALAQVVAAFVAEADGGGARFGRGAVVEAGSRPHPAPSPPLPNPSLLKG